MFIKRLLIKANSNTPFIIRDIEFHKGLNLIVDETSLTDQLQTGNSVGKTTVLRLIDFCLGASRDVVFKAERRETVENTYVKSFLEEHKVSVDLELGDDFCKHIFSRSFVKINGFASWIDGVGIENNDKYKKKIESLLYPGKPNKPTLRQLLSHHIRYQEPGMDSTLMTLHQTTKASEYETLMFYMLGISSDGAADKIAKLNEDLNIERLQLARLTDKYSRNDLELMLESLKNDIGNLETIKTNFGLDENTISDIGELDEIKRNINYKSSQIEHLNIRLSVIEESINTINGEISNIDIESLRNIYEDTRLISDRVLCDFDDLVSYHNKLAENRKKYLIGQIPKIRQNISDFKQDLNGLLKKESELKRRITRRDSYTQISDIISQLNEKYRMKGKIENQLSLVCETTKHIDEIEARLRQIEDNRRSMRIEEKVSERIKEFNKEFSFVSRELYGEDYALSFDDPDEAKKSKYYKFKVISMDNFSTGKKQGEVICFDIAYILFCDSHNLTCMHFLLNDKKELMHNNPISKIAEFVSDKDIQLVFPILRDKIPSKLLDGEYVILSLSQNKKLFRIEEIDGNYNKETLLV